MESAARGNLSLAPALWQVAGGHLFGIRELLARAGGEFAALRGPGELPLRRNGRGNLRAGVEFSNDFLIEKLEARGLRVHLAPKTEWINYCGHMQRRDAGPEPVRGRFQPVRPAAN